MEVNAQIHAPATLTKGKNSQCLLILSQSRGECRHVSGPAANDWFEEESVGFPLAVKDGYSLKGWMLPCLVDTFACDVWRHVNEMAGGMWHKHHPVKWISFSAGFCFVLTNYMKQSPFLQRNSLPFMEAHAVISCSQGLLFCHFSLAHNLTPCYCC